MRRYLKEKLGINEIDVGGAISREREERMMVSYGPWGCKESDVTERLNGHSGNKDRSR